MGTLVNRRRYMGGKALPYDAEIEYLEGTGTQFIDTGIAPSSTIKTVLKFSIKNGFSFSAASFLFGSAYSGSSYYSVALASSTAIRVPKNTSFTNCTIPSINYDEVHTISYKPGEIKYDGQSVGTYSGKLTSSTVDIRLFGRYGNTVDNRTIISYLCVHGYEVYDGESKILDLIPVRVGQVGYMYDKVSGQLFGNAGTGSFTLGPDKT